MKKLRPPGELLFRSVQLLEYPVGPNTGGSYWCYFPGPMQKCIDTLMDFQHRPLAEESVPQSRRDGSLLTRRHQCFVGIRLP